MATSLSNGPLLDDHTQALLAYLLLIWVKLKSTVGWGLLELSRLMQTMLMARTNLWEMLNPKEKAPPPQMVLFNVAGGV
jgi:hypothetical protein